MHCNKKKPECIKKVRMNTYTWLSEPIVNFRYKILLVFEKLSDNNSIDQKLTIRCLVYKFLIITIKFYDFDTFITIFLNTQI